jgi:hypothetical protein
MDLKKNYFVIGAGAEVSVVAAAFFFLCFFFFGAAAGAAGAAGAAAAGAVAGAAASSAIAPKETAANTTAIRVVRTLLMLIPLQVNLRDTCLIVYNAPPSSPLTEG